MPLPKDQAWFPTRRYGWGWGVPTRWQGFAVLLGFIAAQFVGAFYIVPRSPLGFVAYVLALGAILTGICYAKGESPRWRWGDDDRPE